MFPIWTVFSELDIYEKHFPRQPDSTDIEYQYQLLTKPGLIKTKLKIDETFLLSDTDLKK